MTDTTLPTTEAASPQGTERRWAGTLGARVVPESGWGSRARYGATALATLLVLSVSAPSALAYDFVKSITIDRSKIDGVGCGATLTNYPMLFSVTDADLAHTTFGGDVTDLGATTSSSVDSTRRRVADPPPVSSTTRSRSTSTPPGSSSPG